MGRASFQGFPSRNQLLAFAAIAAIMVLAGCGRVSSSGTNTPIISTTLTQSPPSSLLLGQMAMLAANVDNDPAGAGVNWSVSCSPSGMCGSVSPAHTNSGSPTTFTAPLVNTVVTITATSMTNSSKSAVATVTVGNVSFSQAPPQSLITNGMASVTATLPVDPTGAGVDWTATCSSAGACGSFSPMHTASGMPTVYSAPAMMPAGAQVTITVTSTADAAATISQTIAIVTSNITISLSSPLTGPTPPPITQNNMALLLATVSNDPLNAGVDWKLSCSSQGAGACGTLVPTLSVLDTLSNKTSSVAHTDNSAPIAYLAPSQQINGGFVAVTAFSRTDNAITASTVLMVSPATPNGLLAGQFAFQVSGRDANGGNQFTMGGSFVGDGNGNIVAGEADVIDAANPAAPSANASTSLTGTYTMGADGRGQITLKTIGLNSFGANGAITLSVAFVAQLPLSQDLSGNPIPKNRALLSEIDGFGSGTGTLYLQNLGDLALANSSESLLLLPPTSNLECLVGNNSNTTMPCPPGLPLSYLAAFFGKTPLTYVLTLAGAHSGDASKPVFIAGGLTVGDAPAGSGMGQSIEASFAGDASDAGNLTANANSTTTPVIGGVPDNFGRLQFQGLDIAAPIFSSGSSSITTLNAYMVDRYHYVVLQAGDPNFTLSGSLTVFFDPILSNQGPPTLSGPIFAFTESGESSAMPQVAGGLFTCDPSGSQTSLLDVAPLNGTAIANQPINVVCTDPGPNARGTVTLTGTTGNISQFAVYPTTDEGGRNLQLIEIDAAGPSGAGVALPQTVSAPSAANNVLASILSGNYAASFLANTPQGIEGFSGQIVSDGVSALSGTLDVNSLNVTANPVLATPSAGTALSGSYAVPANSPGRFPLKLNISTPAPQAINPVCYIVDENTCLLLGLDTTAPGIGILQLQNLGF